MKQVLQWQETERWCQSSVAVRTWPTGVCASCTAVGALAPPCSFHSHDKKGYLEKLLCIYACVHLRVCSDKTSRITSSEKYHPAMLELLGTQRCTLWDFFQLIVHVPLRLHVDPIFSMSGWDPTVRRNSNITTALRRARLWRALAATKAVPRRATGYNWFCWFLCWCQPNLFRMAQDEWVQRGALLHQRLEGEQRTEGGNPVWKLSRANKLASYPTGKVFPCCLQSQQRKWAYLGHCPAQGGMEGSQLRRKPCSAGAASEQRKSLSWWALLCPLGHNYLDSSFPHVCFRVTERCTTWYLLVFSLGAKYYYPVFSVLKRNRDTTCWLKFILPVHKAEKSQIFFLQSYTQEDE